MAAAVQRRSRGSPLNVDVLSGPAGDLAIGGGRSPVAAHESARAEERDHGHGHGHGMRGSRLRDRASIDSNQQLGPGVPSFGVLGPPAAAAAAAGKMKVYHDYDPNAARLTANQSSSALQILYKKAEEITFVILFYLTDRTGKQPGVWIRVVLPYIFALYDFTQLMSLSLPPGFPGTVTSWFYYPGNAESMAANVEPIVIFWLVVSLIGLLFALTAWVFYMSLSQSLRVTPIRFLRLLANFLVDAAFSELLTQILSQPFGCYIAAGRGAANVAAVSVENTVPSCEAFRSLGVVYFAVSIVILLLFVPYCLLFALIFYDSAPVSAGVEARPHGRFTFLYVAVQAAMIFINLFLNNLTDLNNGINFVLLISLWLLLLTSVPYYSTFTSAFRGGLFLAAATFPITSLLIRNATDVDGPSARHWAVLTQLLLIPAFVGGAVAVYLRVRFLTATQPNSASWKANRGQGRSGSYTLTSPSASLSMPMAHSPSSVGGAAVLAIADREQDDHDAEHDGRNIEVASFAGDFVRSARTARRTVTRRLSSAAASLKEAAAPRFFAVLDACNLLFLVECQRNADLTAAEAIFREGMAAFPRSAYIRIAHALFIRHYKGDTATAAQRMRIAAESCRPALDLRYLVFEKQRMWENLTHGASVGQTLNSLSLLEFEQVFSTATAKHAEALKLTKHFWAGIARRNNAKFLLNASHYIARVSAAAKAASQAYDALLRKYKNSKMLLRAYADFVRSVLNDPEKAAALNVKADEIEEKEAKLRSDPQDGSTIEGDASEVEATSSDGGSTINGDEGHVAQHISSRVTAKKKKKTAGSSYEQILNNEGQLRAVKRLQIGVFIGLGVLAALVTAFYVINRIFLDSIQNGLYLITAMSSQARYIVSVTDHSRTAHLAALVNNSDIYSYQIGRLKVRASQFHDTHAAMYFGGPEYKASSAKSVLRLWNAQEIPFVRYLGASGSSASPTRMRSSTGLWDLGSEFVSRASEFSTLTMAAALKAPTVDSFRFMQDNGPRALTDAVLRGVLIYEDEIKQDRTMSFGLLGAVLGATLGTMTLLVLCVLQPSILRVQRTKTGVSDIIGLIPRKALRKIARYYAKMRGPGEEDSSSSEETTERVKDDVDQGQSSGERDGKSREDGANSSDELEAPDTERSGHDRLGNLLKLSGGGAGVGGSPKAKKAGVHLEGFGRRNRRRSSDAFAAAIARDAVQSLETQRMHLQKKQAPAAEADGTRTAVTSAAAAAVSSQNSKSVAAWAVLQDPAARAHVVSSSDLQSVAMSEASSSNGQGSRSEKPAAIFSQSSMRSAEALVTADTDRFDSVHALKPKRTPPTLPAPEEAVLPVARDGDASCHVDKGSDCDYEIMLAPPGAVDVDHRLLQPAAGSGVEGAGAPAPAPAPAPGCSIIRQRAGSDASCTNWSPGGWRGSLSLGRRQERDRVSFHRKSGDANASARKSHDKLKHVHSKPRFMHDGSSSEGSAGAQVAPAPTSTRDTELEAHGRRSAAASNLSLALAGIAPPSPKAETAKAKQSSEPLPGAEASAMKEDSPKLDHEHSKKKEKTNSIFVRMRNRYMAAFISLALLMTTAYIITCILVQVPRIKPKSVSYMIACLAIVDGASSASTVIRFAGNRRYFARELAYIGREAYIDDGATGFSKAESIMRTVARISDLHLAHVGLKYGNESVGLVSQYSGKKDQQSLLYEPGCLRLDGKCDDATVGYLKTFVMQGLDFCVQQYVATARKMVKENEGFTDECAGH
eukprot:tig00000254_g22561.t1